MPQNDVPDLDIHASNFQAPIDLPTCIYQIMGSDMTLETNSKSLAYDDVSVCMNTQGYADFSADDSGEEYLPEKVKQILLPQKLIIIEHFYTKY
ncbi:unnamed protein product [Parnassius apollo]|uniref:(apollo) hypothetical protein n=1 Tax=Parnassius apollo TaxID=110799 RepID=A0A8S3XSZ5_PARAO|nr:unnamed protein product [Parnassius apollo]